MTIGPKDDELVQKVQAYTCRPVWLHAYVTPFVVLYSILAAQWPYGQSDGLEVWYAVAALTAFVHVLFVLSSQWSVNALCWFAYSRQSDPDAAVYVKVTPTANNGSSELKRLHREPDLSVESSESTALIWFEFQKTRYVYDRQIGRFESLPYPTDLPLLSYLQSRGFERDDRLKSAEQRYGHNDLKMHVPDFMELFRERALAPFFVFQVFCMCLWCLDDYWYYSLFTLGMLVMFECFLVQQQRRNLQDVRKMGERLHQSLMVWRKRKWTLLPADQLLPGDLVALGRSPPDHTLPCDLLLLRGRLIADEALLTGESVPQAKEPLDQLVQSQPDVAAARRLDLSSDGKLHMLFGGTRVLQHTALNDSDGSTVATANGPTDEALASMPRPPNNLCLAYVLQTGFSTSQGKLLRTILFGVKQVTANSLETFAFVLFLLMFALVSAGYLWIEGSKDPNRSRYKLMLECILIITSVVPPELPIELSLAVNASLLSLSRRLIFCTEPFRIPLAGKVELCCFDKTGTLTTDKLRFDGVVYVPDESNALENGDDPAKLPKVDKERSGKEKSSAKKSSSKPSQRMIAPNDLNMDALHVLASCQSLVVLDDRLVGDPLEKSTLAAIDWAPGRNDLISAKKGRVPSVKVLQRFHFSSALKRMSVVASWVKPDLNQTQYLAAVKGAPEVIKRMLKKVPTNYDRMYQDIARKGGRVIALARRPLGPMDAQQLKQVKREQVEQELDFVGFAVYSCPLKADTKKVIREIIDSSHVVVMITGDAPLTACHVASELHMFSSRKTTLILSSMSDDSDEASSSESNGKSDDFEWRVLDHNRSLPLQPPDFDTFVSTFDFCVTGDGLSFLSQQHPQLFRRLLPHVRVWARVAPKQKELLVTSMRDCGYHTLMCGDGTNDVGALKHAHVGIALISNAPLQIASNRANAASAVSPANLAQPNRPNRVARPAANAPVAAQTAPQTALERNQAYAAQLRKMMDELDQQDNPTVKLGDASVAAPFTSRLGSVACVCDVIKQGRCTLVTTLQMFKILALNSLILAYCQSALYLDGIKFSDSQATLQGLLLAGCFLFISRSNVSCETLF
jgi:cation-transporting ATPase 13A1